MIADTPLSPDATQTGPDGADRRTRVRRALLLLLVLGLNIVVWAWALRVPAPLLTVTVLDVGQGDAIAVQTPAGRVLVVDTGRTMEEDDMGRRVVLPFLRAQGINRVDALLLTHPDDDHIGGATTLLRRLQVARLLVSPLPSESPEYRRTLELARERGTEIVTVARGQTLAFGDGVTADVLHPAPNDHLSENNGSLVLRLHYGATSLLLTGDAETEAEEKLLRERTDLRADVLKLGHHGSRTSTSERFLDAVRPQAALVSAGAGNTFGHPHPAILARLETRGIRVFRTDRQGAISLRSDGKTLQITTTDRRRPTADQSGRQWK